MNPIYAVLGALYCFGEIYLSNGQVAEGTPCETPRQSYGLCININRCNELLNLLLTQSNNPEIRNYLRSSTCGFRGNTPMVCCPQVKLRDVNPLVDATTEKSTHSSTNKLPEPPDCGFSNITNPRIVNGIPAKLGEFPWIVALGYRNQKNPQQPKWLCGGALITERHVLTAGHCVYNRNDLYLARVGDLDLFSDSEGAHPKDIPLLKAKIHEEYSSTSFTSDIAILTLKEPAKNIPLVWPICLPLNETLRTKDYTRYQGIAAGWGSLYFNGPSSSHLQEVSLPILDNSQCKKSYGNKSTIDNRILCAGYTNGGKDACQGDSGGPFMLGVAEGNNVRFYLLGVVSYGFRCAEAGYPGVYTRVTEFVDWIERNLD